MIVPRRARYAGPRQDLPPSLPVLIWGQRDASGWWPGMPKRCRRSCGGWLVPEPPAALDGSYLTCGLCGRHAAEIAAHGGLTREIVRGPQRPWGNRRVR